jgi:prepilin-type N-terminal cleavage/methylation domain-containing protein
MRTGIGQRLHADDGVSLVEMLVAMLILGVTLLAMLTSSISSLAGSRTAHNHFDATQRTQRVVEDLLRRPGAVGGVEQAWVPSSPTGSTAPAFASETRGAAQYSYVTQVSWVDHGCNGSAVPANATVPDPRKDYLRITVTTTLTVPDRPPSTQQVVVFRHPNWRPTARGASC